ncbi:MAG: hypothetical protein ABI992_03695 [Chthoniobacterales bacterium]
MRDDNLKPNPSDSSEMEKLLEIELMQKRAAWQQTKARRGTWRALSFLFLFVVILVVLFGFFWLSTSGRLGDMKTHREEAQPSPSPN